MQVAVVEQGRELTFEQWREMGRDMLARQREHQWAAADWFRYGRDRAKTDPDFKKQMDRALPEMAEDPKRLEAVAKVAEAFGPDDRDYSLSFESYIHLARLPHGEARKILDRASKEHIAPRQIREEALGQTVMHITQDDDSLLSAFLRHWNRLPRNVRIDAAEMIAESDYEEIEP